MQVSKETRGIGPLKLKLQKVISYLIQVLRTKLRAFQKQHMLLTTEHSLSSPRVEFKQNNNAINKPQQGSLPSGALMGGEQTAHLLVYSLWAIEPCYPT